MKQVTAIVLLFIWTGITASAQKNITINGTITQPADTRVIVVNATNISILPENKQETLTLSPDGKFSISIPVTQKYNWLIIACGNQRLDFLAKEGSALNLTADGSKLESTAHFTGKGVEVPEYFASLNRNGNGLMGFYSKTQELAIREPGLYEQALDSLKKESQVYLEKNKANVPKEFGPYWSAFLDYSVYDALVSYPVMHEMMRLQSRTIQNIPPALYEVSKKAPRSFNDDYLSMPRYQNYAENYFPTLLSAAGFTNIITIDSTGAEDRSKALQQTDSALALAYTTLPRKTAEFVAGKIIAGGAKQWTLPVLEEHIAIYKKHYPKSVHNTTLDRIAYDIKKFNPGQPALDFSFKDLDGKDVKLSDLKGKVVYMDFWASWCGPCKGEMPYAKKIKEHFQDRKDVIFLYVSIDDKEDAWKRGIEAMNISGMHTRTPGWGGDIAKLYQIQSVPAYFLIDKKGNFVTKKTPRPSQSAELIKLMEGLL